MRAVHAIVLLSILPSCEHDRPGAAPPGDLTPATEVQEPAAPAPQAEAEVVAVPAASSPQADVVELGADGAEVEPRPEAMPKDAHPDSGGNKAEEVLDGEWYDEHCSDISWTYRGDRRCWDNYLIGEFDFGAPLTFDKELMLDLPEPGPMPRKRWRRVKAKINVRAITKALGIRGGFGFKLDSCVAPGDLVIFDEYDECPFYRPGYWWPTDDQVFLVIPHSQRVSPVYARTLTLARKEGDVWKATTIETLLPSHAMGGAWNLYTGPLLRGDGLEFWTFAEGLYPYDESEAVPIEERYICRIGWHDGALRQACAEDWTTQSARGL